MNTALLSLDRVTALGIASTSAANVDCTARPHCTSDSILRQLAAFCTRVLLLGGRSPLDHPMMSRVLLAAYAGGGLDALTNDADLGSDEKLELATLLFRDALGMTTAEANLHATVLVSPAAAASPRLRDIMRRGARAFAQWQVDPAEFVPEDFRELVAMSVARARLHPDPSGGPMESTVYCQPQLELSQSAPAS